MGQMRYDLHKTRHDSHEVVDRPEPDEKAAAERATRMDSTERRLMATPSGQRFLDRIRKL